MDKIYRSQWDDTSIRIPAGIPMNYMNEYHQVDDHDPDEWDLVVAPFHTVVPGTPTHESMDSSELDRLADILEAEDFPQANVAEAAHRCFWEMDIAEAEDKKKCSEVSMILFSWVTREQNEEKPEEVNLFEDEPSQWHGTAASSGEGPPLAIYRGVLPQHAEGEGNLWDGRPDPLTDQDTEGHGQEDGFEDANSDSHLFDDIFECSYCLRWVNCLEPIEPGVLTYSYCRHCYDQFCDDERAVRHLIFHQCGVANQYSGWPEFWRDMGYLLANRRRVMNTYEFNGRIVVHGWGDDDEV